MRGIGLAGVWLWLLLLVAAEGWGQQAPVYRTLKLKEMADLLGVRGIRMPQEGLYAAEAVCPGRQVEMKNDIFGRVGFIGLHLFGEEMSRAYASPVYEFVERYFLELLLAGDHAAVAAKLEEDKVEISLEGVAYGQSGKPFREFACLVDEQTPMAIQSDMDRYTVGWKTERGALQLVFPKQYELIIGADKIEMEKGLMEELARAEVAENKMDTLPVGELEAAVKKGYYIRKGGHYLTNDMHSDTYYKESGDGQAVLLFDAAMPAESLANLFQEGWCGNDRKITMKVTHKCYGNRKAQFELELPQWVAYCKKNKCDVYFGMEQADGQTLKGTVIVVNPDLGFNHMLYFDCPADVFSRLRRDVNVLLYSYVPTHNIKDLFHDQK